MPSRRCSPVSKTCNAHIQILLDASSKTQTQTCFVEERVCWRDAKDAHPPPRHGTQDGRDRSHLGGSWSLNLSGLSSLPISASLLVGLFLQSGFLRNQGHQQLLAPLFLFCHERQKGLILLISSWKIPENFSGWAWITYLPPKLIPVAGNGARHCGWQLSSLEQFLWPGTWSPVRICQLPHSHMLCEWGVAVPQ